MKNSNNPATLAPALGSTLAAGGHWLLPLAGHVAVLVAVYTALYCLGLLHRLPAAEYLLNWDANWYSSIRLYGYVPSATGQSNLAFFPLFPYLWRWLGLGPAGISICNGGLLLAGAALLGHGLGWPRRQVLLVLSFPLMFFCWIPYTEALFFFFGTLVLLGLHRQHLGLTLLGLVGCCVSRSSATLCVPAFVAAEVLACTGPAGLWQLARRLGSGLLAMGGALGTVFYLHYRATGDWFAFFVAHKHWGHSLTVAWAYPLRDSAGVSVLWLDALALVLALLALLVTLVLVVRWATGWLRPAAVRPAVSPATVFSLVFCAAAAAFVLLFQEDNLNGLNRYVFTAPFIWFLLGQLPQLGRLSATGRRLAGGAVVLAVAAVAAWLGFPRFFQGFYPGQAAWFIALWVAYGGALGLAWWPGFRWQREAWAGLYMLNAVLFCYFLDIFLLGYLL